MRRVSVSTVAFDGHPLPVALEAMARCGAAAAELAYIAGYGDFDESAFGEAAGRTARAALAAAGLACFGISAHIALDEPGAADKLRRRAAFAHAVGATILITNAGRRQGASAVEAAIAAALPDYVAAGVILALENPGHGTGALFGRAAEGAALAARFACPQLRLNYDVGNVLTYSSGRIRPEADLGAVLPWLAHAHLKDIADAGADWRFVALGDGQIDYAAVAALLAPADIPVGLELPLRLHRPARADPIRGPAPLPLAAIEEAVGRSLAAWAACEESAAAAGPIRPANPPAPSDAPR